MSEQSTQSQPDQANPDQAIPDSSILEQIPTATIRHRRLSWAWLVPIIALAITGYFVWDQVIGAQGERIIIRFADASGIRVGTAIMHRGVPVGVVRALELDHELEGVLVHSELSPNASGLAVEGTEFWVVYPEVSLNGIAGLETLLGPNYIALQPGESGEGELASPKLSFKALDHRPISSPAADGSLRLILTSDRLGTLSPGSPVLYREIPVGTVRYAMLAQDATHVIIELDIEPRYRPLVHEKTRFWRSGGVGVDFGLFSGLTVQADSLQAAMSSSISFATPSKKMGELASPGDVFELADGVDEDWLKWSPKIELGG